MSHASITLVGRVGKDPETRSTTGGKSVTSFSVGVNDGYGENASTSWFDISVWDKLSESVPKFVKKGALVLVEGTVKIRKFQGKDGQDQRRTEVTGHTVKRLDTKSEGAANTSTSAPAQSRAAVSRPAAVASTARPFDDTEIQDDDIPF